MIVFFENVISFGVKISLILSNVFGLWDFLILTVRGAMVVVPVLFILEEEIEYRRYKEQKKIIKDRVRDRIKRQNPHTEVDEEQVRILVRNKIKRLPHKTFFISNPAKSLTFRKLFRRRPSEFTQQGNMNMIMRVNQHKKLSVFSRKKTIVRNNKFKIRLSSIGDLTKPASILQWVGSSNQLEVEQAKR